MCLTNKTEWKKRYVLLSRIPSSKLETGRATRSPKERTHTWENHKESQEKVIAGVLVVVLSE